MGHNLQLRCTPSVQKYLSSKWIKKDVSKTKIRLDASPFINFDDKYFQTEGVVAIISTYYDCFEKHVQLAR